MNRWRYDFGSKNGGVGRHWHTVRIGQTHDAKAVLARGEADLAAKEADLSRCENELHSIADPVAREVEEWVLSQRRARLEDEREVLERLRNRLEWL